MKKMLPLVAALFAAATTTALATNYAIYDFADLQTFMQNAHNPPYYEGDTVTLKADIDCEGEPFTTGASVVRSGTACLCMFEPIRARFASSFCRKGIRAVATENTIFGETSI